MELRHALKAEHYAKPTLPSPHDKVFELALVLERAKFVDYDPDLFAGGTQLRR
jgi:hypothetical protein